MAAFLQYSKVGKPILYKTLPEASSNLLNVYAQVGEKVYKCDGTQWVEIGTPKEEESKTITITENGTTTVSPTEGKVLSSVEVITEVPSTPTEDKSVALNMADGNQVITPSEGRLINSITVLKPETFIPENIKKDVVIGGITGTLEGEELPLYTGLFRFDVDPEIKINLNNLQFVTTSKLAKSYDLYINNTFTKTYTSTSSINLSSMITMHGSTPVYILQKATNYTDAQSNIVNYGIVNLALSQVASNWGPTISYTVTNIYDYNTIANVVGTFKENIHYVKFKLASDGTVAAGTYALKSEKLGLDLQLEVESGVSSEIASDFLYPVEDIDDLVTEKIN